MSQQGFYGVGGMCGLREDRNLGSRSCTDVNADGGKKNGMHKQVFWRVIVVVSVAVTSTRTR